MLMAWSYLYNNKLMGARQQNPQNLQSHHIEKPKPLTPLELWNASQRSPEDLTALLSHCQSWPQCGAAVSSFLRGTGSRDKYQHCLSVVLQYLRNEQNRHQLPLNERKELFTYYLLRLANSFFVVEDFHESSISLTFSSKQKLLILYEYYSMNEQLLEKALLFNYPAIFIELPQFTSEVLEHQIVINNIQHFLRFILNKEKMEVMRDQQERMMPMLTKNQYEQVNEAMMRVQDLKETYLAAGQQFMNVDNADHASLLFRTLISKGYILNEQEYEYWLKIELFGMFLYSLGKLSLTFDNFKDRSVIDLIHFFYDSRSIEDTPELLACFGIFQDGGERWSKCIMEYCFSPQAHISLFIRLKQYKHINLDGSETEFAGILSKVINSKSQVGRYKHELEQIAGSFDIKEDEKDKFIKLVKMVECLHVFGVNVQIEELCPIIYGESGSDGIGIFQQSGLEYFRMLIDAFFQHPDTSSKTINVQGIDYPLVNLYDLLTFLSALKTYLLHNYISLSTIHHLLFYALLQKAYYSEVSVLLSAQNLSQYNIIYQPIQLLVIDHLITIFTTRKIKKQQSNITLLMSAIGIEHRRDSTVHYVVAYYRYYKYLEEKYISLTEELKEKVGMEHLYYIMEQYGAKIDSLDFDYLYTQISSIRQQITALEGDPQTRITDQYLKFKIQLSNKCFSLKKTKAGHQIIQEVIRFQPPWLGSALVEILKVNDNVDEQFMQIVFNYCSRGQDLAYLLKVYTQKNNAKNEPSSKYSLKNIKKFGDTLRSQKYVFLSNDLIVNQRQYTNLVAEITYSKSQELRQQLSLFFKLLPCDVNRAFNYAVNYIATTDFVISFLMEGVRRDVINMINVLEEIIRYLYFKMVREERQNYVKMVQYSSVSVKQLARTVSQWEASPQSQTQTFQLFKKHVNNYETSKLVTPQFLELYVKDSVLYRFMFDQRQRKALALEIRQQPMNKTNSLVLKKLCGYMGVDIVELSLYELFGRVNTKEDVDNQGWTLVQKLIYWGSDDKKVARNVVKKISQKIECLNILVRILEFIRESEPFYRQIVTEQHLQILSSLAAVEQDNNLFGIVPDNYLDRPIGVYNSHPQGMLSQPHRRLIEQNGTLSNIFVISKALFFMYGCDPQIEKVILGEFSLRQEDSQQFELLRKKIKQ